MQKIIILLIMFQVTFIIKPAEANIYKAMHEREIFYYINDHIIVLNAYKINSKKVDKTFGNNGQLKLFLKNGYIPLSLKIIIEKQSNILIRCKFKNDDEAEIILSETGDLLKGHDIVEEEIVID